MGTSLFRILKILFWQHYKGFRLREKIPNIVIVFCFKYGSFFNHGLMDTDGSKTERSCERGCVLIANSVAQVTVNKQYVFLNINRLEKRDSLWPLSMFSGTKMLTILRNWFDLKAWGTAEKWIRWLWIFATARRRKRKERQIALSQRRYLSQGCTCIFRLIAFIIRT